MKKERAFILIQDSWRLVVLALGALLWRMRLSRRTVIADWKLNPRPRDVDFGWHPILTAPKRLHFELNSISLFTQSCMAGRIATHYCFWFLLWVLHGKCIDGMFMSSIFYSFPMKKEDPKKFQFYLIVWILAVASSCSPRRVVTSCSWKSIKRNG